VEAEEQARLHASLFHERLLSYFGQIYLTLSSIIQGVAAGFLASIVTSNYRHFSAVPYILTFTTLLVIIEIWHEYAMGVMAFSWIPTIADTIIPFFFGVIEVFLAQSLSEDPFDG
jgi:hypothetical protein